MQRRFLSIERFEGACKAVLGQEAWEEYRATCVMRRTWVGG
jgi:hypothetical protein